MKDLIHITAVSDENYAQHLSAMLVSILENTNDPKRIRIHILCDRIKSITKERLDKMIQKYNAGIYFYDVDSSVYSNLTVRHISYAAYCKLSIPNVLNNLEKVIFLDCDMIVIEDIGELWELNIDEYHVAAVLDYFAGKRDGFYDEVQTNDKIRKYFNSGLMYINLKKWRETNISSNAMDFLDKNSQKVVYHDQAGLNRAIQPFGWLELPPKWNQCPWFYRYSFKELGFDKKEFEEALMSPAIIHYAGPSKPWHYFQSNDIQNHLYRDKYLYYLQFTPWKDYEYFDKSFFERKIIIFGAGDSGLKVKKRIENLGHSISYFVDNDKNKWNSSIDDKMIFSPEKLLSEDKNNITIVTASYKFIEINDQLKKMGFEPGKHFIHSRGVRTYSCY